MFIYSCSEIYIFEYSFQNKYNDTIVLPDEFKMYIGSHTNE